jgi:hypothetical protein
MATAARTMQVFALATAQKQTGPEEL